MVKSVQLLRVGFWTACFSVENKTEIPAEGNAADADKKTEWTRQKHTCRGQPPSETNKQPNKQITNLFFLGDTKCLKI